MNEQEVNTKFGEIITPNKIKEKRPPAKFPEIRYLWSVTLLGSFILIVLSSIVQTFTGK